MELLDNFKFTCPKGNSGKTFSAERYNERRYKIYWDTCPEGASYAEELVRQYVAEGSWEVLKEVSTVKQLPKQFKFTCKADWPLVTYTADIQDDVCLVSWTTGRVEYRIESVEIAVAEGHWTIQEEKTTEAPATLSLQQLKDFCEKHGEIFLNSKGYTIYFGGEEIDVKSDEDLLSAMEAIKTLENIRGKSS